MNVSEIDWKSWKPSEKANLCFVVRGGKILLIRKKRGFGAGKINAPGGRNEPGETPEQSAIRELQEEVHVTPTGVSRAGELFFEFVDGYKLQVSVFRADDCEGTPQETDEAEPFWVPLDKIPYPEMWADDEHWLPLLLERREFTGYFTFDGDTLLSHRVHTRAGPENFTL